VPYSDAEISGAETAIKTQADGIVQRLATAKIQAEPDKEIIALIAYLQRMGVDGRAALKAQGVQ
jgi:cytochrome c oxidase cbb3-type subunit I/II